MSSGIKAVHIFDLNVRNHALLFRTENEFVLYTWMVVISIVTGIHVTCKTHPYNIETLKTESGDRRENW